MLKTLKKMWGSPGQGSSKQRGHDISLAVTALMVEVMHQDDHIASDEQDAIVKAIQKRFDVPKLEAEVMIKRATQAGEQANDLHQFTAPIIKAYSQQERIEIVCQLWMVAMADQHIDPYEEALIRKIAELLGVHHHQFIHAKIEAKKKSQYEA